MAKKPNRKSSIEEVVKTVAEENGVPVDDVTVMRITQEDMVQGFRGVLNHIVGSSLDIGCPPQAVVASLNVVAMAVHCRVTTAMSVDEQQELLAKYLEMISNLHEEVRLELAARDTAAAEQEAADPETVKH